MKNVKIKQTELDECEFMIKQRLEEMKNQSGGVQILKNASLEKKKKSK